MRQVSFHILDEFHTFEVMNKSSREMPASFIPARIPSPTAFHFRKLRLYQSRYPALIADFTASTSSGHPLL